MIVFQGENVKAEMNRVARKVELQMNEGLG